MSSALETLKHFDTHTLPDLDVAVLGALELSAQTHFEGPPLSSIGKKPLVIGSGNAHQTGKILFDDMAAVFARARNYEKLLAQYSDRDSVVIISASGGKGSVDIAKDMREQGIPTWLFTNNDSAPAREYIDSDKVVVFPQNREPYTYNTSTYLSMILSYSNEDAEDILGYIRNEVDTLLPTNLNEYSSFLITVPPKFRHMDSILELKFSELFGPCVQGRICSTEEIKHGRTVVSSDHELYIGFDVDSNVPVNKNRVVIPLNGFGYGGMFAIGYYVVGKIQAAHPPYFKDHIGAYVKRASEVFHQDINVIVE